MALFFIFQWKSSLFYVLLSYLVLTNVTIIYLTFTLFLNTLSRLIARILIKASSKRRTVSVNLIKNQLNRLSTATLRHSKDSRTYNLGFKSYLYSRVPVSKTDIRTRRVRPLQFGCSWKLLHRDKKWKGGANFSIWCKEWQIVQAMFGSAHQF